MIIDYRYSRGKSHIFPRLVSELVASKVDLIVATTSPAIKAAQQATTTIPVVVVSVNNPIAEELVRSWSRPGGNITGVSILRPGLNGKLLELLPEAVPRGTRFAALWSPAAPGAYVTDVEAAARALNVELKVLQVRGPAGLEKTFVQIMKDSTGAIVLLPSVLFVRRMGLVTKFAIDNRLPAIFWRSDFAEKGGFMAYGPNFLDHFRRAGVLAGKILRGSKPGDLPIEQSMKFELVINLKTAEQIGITVAPNVLYRADRLIK